MRKVRFDIDGDAVKGNPFAHPDTDGGDLVLPKGPTGIGTINPDADPTLAPFPLDVEKLQAADHPFFQIMNIAADIRSAPLQVNHRIGNPLSRPVIGELPAAPCFIDGESVGAQQVFPSRACPGGIERRVF